MQSLAPFFISLALSAALTPVARAVARSRGLLDIPTVRKAHQSPTPLLGGAAVFAALAVSATACGLLTGRTAGIALASALLFGLGLWDDVRGASPPIKFGGQILAAAIAVVFGLAARITGIAPIDIALTLFWLVGQTNALNLLDNMDGISSGVAAIAGLSLFFAASFFGDGFVGGLALCVCGAALGFLLYNFPPASIFLGDAGSMVYGFVLAGAGVLLMNDAVRPSDMLVPPALMGLATLDTTLVTVVRTLEGRRVSEGGKDHISHRLAALGLTPRAVAAAHYLLSAAFGIMGVAFLMAGVAARVMLVIVFVCTSVLIGVAMGRVRVEARGGVPCAPPEA